MDLPNELTLRIEPLFGLIGNKAVEGSAICPLCGSVAIFCLVDGHGSCDFCGTVYTCISVTSAMPDNLNSKLMTFELDYSHFTVKNFLHPQLRPDIFGSMNPRGDM